MRSLEGGMSTYALAKAGKLSPHLLPMYPFAATGTATKILPIKHATMANPGFSPSATALLGTSIIAALKPSAIQNPPTVVRHH